MHVSVIDFHTTFNLIIKIEKMIVLCTFNKKHNIACCTAVDDVTFEEGYFVDPPFVLLALF